MNDLDIDLLFAVLAPLEQFPEAVRRYDRWGSCYKSQKAHWLIWLSTQDTTGSGAYRRRTPNRSGRLCYNRILNPGMLIWMAAVLGAEDETIRRAADEAIAAERINYRGRCNAFRRVISFDDILRLIQAPENWKCDPEFEKLCVLDAENIPAPEPGKEAEYNRILDEQLGFEKLTIE